MLFIQIWKLYDKQFRHMGEFFQNFFANESLETSNELVAFFSIKWEQIAKTKLFFLALMWKQLEQVLE